MYEFLEYRVADAMTYHPVSIGPHTTLAEVERLFEQHDFDALPVTEDGALVGLVTKLDFLKAFAFTKRTKVPRYAEIMERPAKDVMNRRPFTLGSDQPLTRVLQLMTETRFKSFPVVVGSLLIGMLSRQDVLRALRRAAAGKQPVTASEQQQRGRATLHS